MLEVAHADLEQYLTGDRWFQRTSADSAGGASALPKAIAYFSPEYGITSVLPQYSGGLGILAGDHLKTASDLGIPLIGVGLLYRHGYFRQQLSREGWQQETYPVLDPDGLPITLLREEDGSAAQVRITVPGEHELAARIFVAQVGRVPLLLLDTDVEDNPGPLREVTDRLYGGTSEHRLQQELLLGIGGVRALRTFSRITGAEEPEVFHTNEGHAGFLGLERIRELTVADGGPGLDFDTALEVTRAGTVFTTHTPVPAGIDRFARDLIEQYFGSQSPVAGVPTDRILSLGAEDYDGGDSGVFNMAVMGFRLSQRANGVSLLHGEVSRGHVQRPLARLRRGRGADHLDHQRRARPHLGRSRGLRAGEQARRRHRQRRPEPLGGRRQDPGDRPVGDQARAACQVRRRRPDPAAQVLAQAGCGLGRARLDRHRARPRRAHHRVRAPGAVVQATDADAA